MSSQRDAEQRVVVTGIGCVSPVGIGAAAYWESLQAGRSGVDRIELLSASPVPNAIAGEVRNFEANKFLRTKDQKKSLKVMCREIQLAVVGAQLALEDAGAWNLASKDGGVPESVVSAERLGVEFGANLMFSPPTELAPACFVCVDQADQRFHFERWGKDMPADKTGMSEMEPLWLLKYLPNMPACHIGISADARGPNNSLTQDDASGNLAIGEALRVIARGHADIMITGTTGTRLHAVKSIHARMWDQLAHTDGPPAEACRPFDRDRTGQVVAEASCTLILEEEQHARARGARIYGRILGAGSSCVLGRDGRPDLRRALVQAIRGALADARLQPQDVGHINAHGTGEIETDRREAEAIHEVFGRYASEVPVTALKSYFGNSGSGAGILEVAGSLLGLAHGVVVPTLNYRNPDPHCRLNVVADKPRPVSNGVFLKLNVTRMGQASAILASTA